jgi:predicted permease
VRFWEQRFLKAEFALAVVVSVVFVVWAESWGGLSLIAGTTEARLSDIYGVLAQIYASLLGFVITVVSIILGYSTNPRLAILRSSRHYNDLWRTFKSAIRALSLATLTSLLGLVFQKNDALPLRIALYPCVFATILSCLRLGRCIWILNGVIAVVTKPNSRLQGSIERSPSDDCQLTAVTDELDT